MQVRIVVSHAMAAQLRAYVMDREREGWYYGNKHDFEQRHLKLIAAIDLAIHRAIEKGSTK
jgi:hypothetical protein